ncbi:hypothetical protein PMI01_01592 [Caulobacter sp. AP07]|uniref:hypothetical protein n=1 Tax=Caulobacter sp. AP07 TaxID=1144304 RepID=UPI0002721FF5|nr:hypothetical protein [Caulobacter sp. AP07]EJL34535.1 hypothetical protein PMI01_01592 [Caulobacter sp. AP07]
MNAIRTTLALAAAALLAGCKPAPADKAAPPTGKDAAHVETGKLLTELMAPSFKPEQQGRIINMSYYMAASALCPTLEVDSQKMGRAVQAVLDVDAAGATDAQKQHQHDALLMFLGMGSGAMIADHIDDKDQFCADATKLKAGAPDTHLFTTTTPSAPNTAPVPAAPAPAGAPKT